LRTCYYVTRKQRVNASQRALRLNYRFKTLDLTGRQRPRLIKNVLKTYKNKPLVKLDDRHKYSMNITLSHCHPFNTLINNFPAFHYSIIHLCSY
jgi:hypothetical protein